MDPAVPPVQVPPEVKAVATVDPIELRKTKILNGIDYANTCGLEIGPLDRPMVDKRKGFKIKYLDFNSTETLRDRFKNDPKVSAAEMAEVDFVITGGNILEVVREKFDYIIASHVFEHVPNPVLWLHEMAEFLNPNGILSLAVPDRRFTFDIIRPPTSVGEMLEAFYMHRTRPTFKNVFDQNHYWRNINAHEVWRGECNPWSLLKPGDKDVILSYARTALETDQYIDVHCNILTSYEFLFFLEALKSYDLDRFELHTIHHCEEPSNEFVVQMTRKPDAEIKS
jgi:SAM-dependent methyltransferase